MKGFIPTFSTIDLGRTEPTGVVRKSHISHIRIAQGKHLTKDGGWVIFYLMAEVRDCEYRLTLTFRTKEEVLKELKKITK